MEKSGFTTLLRRTVAIPVIALAILAAVLLWEIQSLNSSLQWVDHTDQVIGTGQLLIKRIIDVETGARGFLGSGDEQFLQPYSEAKPSIDSKFDQLNQLVSDNPAQQAQLAALRSRFNEWLTYIESRIALRRSTRSRLEASLEGKRLMDALRTEHDAFIASEERLRTERVRKARNASRLVTASCVLLSLGIGFFIAFFTQRRMSVLAADFQKSLDVAKQRAEELRSSQAKLHGIVSSAMDAIISVDEQQRIVVFNQAAEFVFQCPASEAVGSTLDRFIPKNLREVHREHIRQFGGAGATARSMFSPGVLTAVRASSEEFPIEATISQVQADGEKLYTVILRDVTERKRAEEEVAEAKRRAEEVAAQLRTIVESMTERVYVCDSNGNPILGNAAYRNYGGRTELPVFPKSFTDVMEVFDLSGRAVPVEEWPISRALRGEQVRGLELLTRFKHSGQENISSYNASPVFDSQGKVAMIVLTSEDIAERKRAEAALQESLGRLERVLEVETVGVMFWDLTSGVMVDANDTFLKLMGYGRSDIEERRLTWQKLTPPEYIDVSRAEVEKFMATGRVGPYEKEYFRKDGTRHWLLFAGSSLGNNQCVEFCVDISDRKKAEQALRESEARWATTLQSIGDAVISTDATGHIEFMNDVAQRLTGWPLPEAKGRELEEVFNIVQEVTRIRPESPVAKVIRLGKVVGLANHTALINRDGSEIPIEDSGAPIRNREGEIEGVVLVFHDVSEQRKVEKALRNSDRLATTGRLAATIAHEIHNPLDTVSNLLFLIGQGAPEEDTRQYVSMASQELTRVTQITQQMLTFQREAAKPVPVKIGDILDSVTALYDRKIQSAGIHLKQQIDFDGHILALPGELRQVFANLVGNAIEAVGPRHGTITLRAYASRDWRRERPGLRVIVADDGPGIPAAVRTSIFEPFFTTKGESGTGLGLWITSDILRKYDGTLRLRSSTQSEYSGACFSVFFPFEASPGLLERR